MVVQEKHGNRYFRAGSKKALHASCLKLLQERFGFGYYWDNEAHSETEGHVVEILGDEDGAAAWAFLRSRACHDYEHVHLETLE